MNARRHVAGFTLLEILLALVLLAFVMAGVWGALAGANRLTRSADAVMAQGESVRMSDQFLRRWLGAATPQPFTTTAASRARMFEGNATSMRYVAPLPMQSGHAGLYVQSLSLDKGDSETRTLRLAYRPYTGEPAPHADPTTHVLLSNLHDGKFQYLAAGGFGKPAAWRDDWNAVNGMPLAVRIHLDPAWSTRVAAPDLVIRLQAGDGQGLQTAGGAP